MTKLVGLEAKPGEKRQISTGEKCRVCNGDIVGEEVYQFLSNYKQEVGPEDYKWKEISRFCSKCGIMYKFNPASETKIPRARPLPFPDE